VYRSGDARKTMPEAVQNATEQLEQQSRAMGQGVEALRNSVGHRLGLTPQSARPLVIANAGDKLVDVGMAFRDGGVELRDPTDSEYRDLKVRIFNATGSMATDGNMIVKGDALAGKFRGNLGGVNDGYAGYGQWHGGVSGDGAATQVDAGYILSGGNMKANGNINAGISIAAALNVFDGVGNLRTQSERALKDHHGDLDPAVVDRFRTGRFSFKTDSGVGLPVPTSEWVPLDPEDPDSQLVERPALDWVPDESVHVGLYVDEMDEADPDLVRRGADGHRTFEDRGVVAYLVSAVQDLRARVAELEAQLAGSTSSDDQPE
jgi:hypothetical protein